MLSKKFTLTNCFGLDIRYVRDTVDEVRARLNPETM